MSQTQAKGVAGKRTCGHSAGRCSFSESLNMLMRRTSRRGLGATLGMPDNLSEAKAQWCTTFPFFCSAATVAASNGLLNPDLYYPTPPVLAQGASTAGVIDYSASASGSTLLPGVQEDPYAAIDAAIADQTTQNQSAMQTFFNNLSTPSSGGSCSMNLGVGICDWIVYAVGAAAVFGLILLGSRR